MHPLMQALHNTSAAATIQHLKISLSTLQQPYPSKLWVLLGENQDRTTARQLMRVQSCLLLHDLENLVSLELSGGNVMSPAGWLAFPPKLRRLELGYASYAPSDESTLSHLRELVVTQSEGATLAQVLHAASEFITTLLRFLDVAECNTQALSELTYIFQQTPFHAAQQADSP